MLDIKKIRESFDEIKKSVESRGQGDYEIGRVLELDEKRRSILGSVEQMKNKQKQDSKEIPKLKKVQ
jgi:seryl-tRNA synthetase